MRGKKLCRVTPRDHDISGRISKGRRSALEQRLLAGTPEDLGGAAPPSPPSRYFGYGGRDRGWGDTWEYFGWVCAAQDSKLAPGSKKNFP